MLLKPNHRVDGEICTFNINSMELQCCSSRTDIQKENKEKILKYLFRWQSVLYGKFMITHLPTTQSEGNHRKTRVKQQNLKMLEDRTEQNSLASWWWSRRPPQSLELQFRPGEIIIIIIIMCKVFILLLFIFFCHSLGQSPLSFGYLHTFLFFFVFRIRRIIASSTKQRSNCGLPLKQFLAVAYIQNV